MATPPSRPIEIRSAFDDERMAHAGHRLHIVEVRGRGLAAEHRTLLEHRVPACRGRVKSIRQIGLPVTIAFLSTRPSGLPMIV